MRLSQAPHVIRSRNVVLPDGVRPASVHLRDGRIKRVGPWEDTGEPSLDVQDAGDLFVLPGLVDTHVHINEPGREEWEGFATATAAAAAGGVTTLLDMPLNSVPATTNERALDKKRRAAEGKCRVDVGFLGGVVPGNSANLKPLWDAGVFAFKCFMVPSGVSEFGHVGVVELEKAMPILRDLGGTLMAHCELPEFLGTRNAGLGTRNYAEYEASRPPEAEVAAVKLLTDLARKHSARVHVVHVSAQESLAPILMAKASGVAVSAETCPHYLAIETHEVPEGATEFKCAPPIRGATNQTGLWQALKDGVLDMIVSDHSPCPPASKRKDTGDFFAAWGGIASLELGLSVICTEMRHRKVGPDNLAKWMAEGPAQLAGLAGRKGTLAAGVDADVVIFDPFEKFTVDAALLHQKHKITPYHGRELTGRVHATYLRGQLIFANGKTLGPPSGRLLSRVR
jgi:allantoinase